MKHATPPPNPPPLYLSYIQLPDKYILHQQARATKAIQFAGWPLVMTCDLYSYKFQKWETHWDASTFSLYLYMVSCEEALRIEGDMTTIFQLRREKATVSTDFPPSTTATATHLSACSCLVVAAHTLIKRQVTDAHTSSYQQTSVEGLNQHLIGREREKESGWVGGERGGHVLGASVHVSRWEAWKEVENYCKLAQVDCDETVLWGCLKQTGREGGADEDNGTPSKRWQIRSSRPYTRRPKHQQHFNMWVRGVSGSVSKVVHTIPCSV